MTEASDEILVDAHLHLWDPQRIRMSWLAEHPSLDRAIEVADLLDGLGPDSRRLAASVLVESAVDDDSLEAEVAWIADQLAAPGPVQAAVAGWRPMAGKTAVSRRLDALQEVPGVVGLREVLHPPDRNPSDLLDDRLVASVRLAGTRGFLVELCVRPDQLDSARELMDRAPETTFVLDHLGRPRTDRPLDPDWVESMARLADRPGLSTKMSALIECAEGSPWSVQTLHPFVSVAIDRFGTDRVMWGSNWPVCFIDGPLPGWIEATDRLLAGLPAPGRAAILGDNARRIYGIS